MNRLRPLAAIAMLLLIPRQVLARPLDKVTASGELLVAVYEDYPPFSFLEKGEPAGVDVEIARELAAALGVKSRFLIRMAGESVDDDLRANVWRGDLIGRQAADLMLHVPLEASLARRNAEVVFCCGYFRDELAVAVDPDAGTVQGFGAFRSKKIAAELGTISDQFLSAAFGGVIGPNVLRGKTFEEAHALFVEGSAAALMASRGQLEWAAHLSGKTASIAAWPMPGIANPDWKLGIAVKEDSRDLAYALEDAIAGLSQSGKLAAIAARYGVTYRPADQP